MLDLRRDFRIARVKSARTYFWSLIVTFGLGAIGPIGLPAHADSRRVGTSFLTPWLPRGAHHRLAQVDATSTTNRQNSSAPASVTPPIDPDLTRLIERARALLNQGQALAAYQLLSLQEFEGSGMIEFDYLLGVAALDAGMPDKATLALERVLAINPNFAGARIDIGRAYMLLGSYEQARNEFEIVLSLNPPEVARRRVLAFLEELDKLSAPTRMRLAGYAAASVGRDTNVNSSTRERELFIPLIGDLFTLSPTNVKLGDNFLTISAGLDGTYSLSNSAEILAAGDVSVRHNAKFSEFDISNFDLRLGGTKTRHKQSFGLNLLFGKTYLDQHINRNLVGVTGDWRYTFNQQNQLQIISQYARLRFPNPNLQVFNTDQSALSVGWLHALAGMSKGLTFASIFVGTENNPSGNPSGAKSFAGVRFAGQVGLKEKWLMVAAASGLSANYDREEELFAATRHDVRYDLNLFFSYEMRRGLSMRPQINFARQDSNIQIYDFARTELSLTLRWDFR